MASKLGARFVLILFVALGGCRQRAAEAPAGPLRVAVSIAPQAWLVHQVGGPGVDVVTMVQPGESHETYQPTDAQISRVISSAAYFCIGIPLENSRAFMSIRSHGKPRLVDMREGIKLRDMEQRAESREQRAEGRGQKAEDGGHTAGLAADGTSAHKAEDSFSRRRSVGAKREEINEHNPTDDESHHGHVHEGKDPHVWLTPRLLAIQACTVATTLRELDPGHREVYDRNLAKLQARLAMVDSEIRLALAPVEGKAFFVFHPAWGYFADEYGLKQVGIEQEGKDPSDEESTALQKAARQQGIRVIFQQPQIASRGAEAIARAVGARVEMLDPLAAEVPDNLLRAAHAIADSYRQSH